MAAISIKRRGPGEPGLSPGFGIDALVFFGDPHAAISDGIVTGTGIECRMNVRARITLLKDRVLDVRSSPRAGAVHFVGVGPNVEEATEDAARRAVDFAVARTGLGREEAYMLLSIIGALRVGTSAARQTGLEHVLPHGGMLPSH
jgi:acetamidase/formamidase